MIMIGEFDFMDTFTWNDIKSAQVVTKEGLFKNIFPIFIQIVFLLALFFASIIIGNLILGIAVNNVRELFKQAGFFKLQRTVEQIKISDDFVNGRLMTFVKKISPNIWKTSLLSKIKSVEKNGFCDKEVFFVCVEPNEVRIQDENKENFIESESFEVFSSDGQKKKARLNLQLPGWIIRATFKRLREKQKLLEELNESLQIHSQEILRDYDTVQEKNGTIRRNKKFSEMRNTYNCNNPPITEMKEEKGTSQNDHSNTDDEINWELNSVNIILSKIARRQLTHEQKQLVNEKLGEFKFKLIQIENSYVATT